MKKNQTWDLSRLWSFHAIIGAWNRELRCLLLLLVGCGVSTGFTDNIWIRGFEYLWIAALLYLIVNCICRAETVVDFKNFKILIYRTDRGCVMKRCENGQITQSTVIRYYVTDIFPKDKPNIIFCRFLIADWSYFENGQEVNLGRLLDYGKYRIYQKHIEPDKNNKHPKKQLYILQYDRFMPITVSEYHWINIPLPLAENDKISLDEWMCQSKKVISDYSKSTRIAYIYIKDKRNQKIIVLCVNEKKESFFAYIQVPAFIYRERGLDVPDEEKCHKVWHKYYSYVFVYDTINKKYHKIYEKETLNDKTYLVQRISTGIEYSNDTYLVEKFNPETKSIEKVYVGEWDNRPNFLK